MTALELMMNVKVIATIYPGTIGIFYTGVCSYIEKNTDELTVPDYELLINLIQKYRDLTNNRGTYVGEPGNWRDPRRLALIDFMIKELEAQS